MLGDESCVGLALWLRRSFREFSGALEVEEISTSLASDSGLDLLRRDPDERGRHLLAWLDRHPIEHELVYLSGHAQTIQRLLRALRARRVSKDQIVAEPYWADGKVGL